ncbi:MAG TPA: maltose alpha-D-glucosyltransferase [Nitrolancea sp.]|nr:maltose alpha-D-glucosyltransferase [Nitrolancea sp.]
MAQDDDATGIESNPIWYKDAIIYQLHPRAYGDSNADGIGDFRGLIDKLDYIQDLGVTAIWLLPFYPSPGRDDGYDIADYTSVNPDYGSVADVRRLVREAHKRGLRVITELVCNHTSDQHPWFQRARRAQAGSAWRDYYVWTDNPEKYKDARIIFKDFETSNWSWDPEAGAYYWHRFYHHQPDLNFDNPRVHRAMFSTLDFWLRMGIDGLRLDAIPYLYEREGTNCENLPETHEFLKLLRRHVDAEFDGRMLLAEANQWPEDAVAYFGDGDECHMSFHFPLMPRMFMALRMEDRYPIVDIMAQTPEVPPTSQWALFLRNHDELTLEMVTDEERDYMYRVYAHDPRMRINLGIRRRLAPLLGNDRRRIELLNGLLFSMPGTPVIYYGDEIGMGDNIYLGDRNGVRTPMQWSADRNAGFSEAPRQRLYLPVIVDAEYHYEAVNVEAQQANPHSLLWWMKRLIALRKQYRAFGRGSLEFLHPDNRRILAYIRQFQDEQILVVANLSRFVQAVELDLSAYQGLVPVELFGRNEFPQIGEQPYFLTLGPHSFFWFNLQPARVEVSQRAPGLESLPVLTVSGRWEHLLEGKGRRELARVLPGYLVDRRWFGGKARKIKSVSVTDSMPFPFDETLAFITLVQVDYVEGDSQTYLLPITYAPPDYAVELEALAPQALIARVRSRTHNVDGVLFDATYDAAFDSALLAAVRGRRRLRGEGEVRALPLPALRDLLVLSEGELCPAPLRAEQSNSSICYDERLILKLFRRVEIGPNPDLEVSQFLTSHGFEHTPAVAGSIEYLSPDGKSAALAMLQGYVPNQGDAWEHTLGVLGRFFERAITEPIPDIPPSLEAERLILLAGQELPVIAHDLTNGFLGDAELLGERTGEMHQTLARGQNAAFAPEPINSFSQRSIYQSMRAQAGLVLPALRKQLGRMPAELRDDAEAVLEAEGRIQSAFRRVVSTKIEASRIRIHGDYHLGQVLYTGRDFSIIDFEGEPARPLSERRHKRSPLIDVAGMLRSFHYATYFGLRQEQGSRVRPEDVATLERWAGWWTAWVSSRFLSGYLRVTAGASFVPAEPAAFNALLDAFLINKAIYEVGYELNNRPEWVSIPLKGLLRLIED